MRHSDLEDLSAFLDGELPAGRAAEVARLVRDEPDWAAACAELRALDAALAGWDVPPPPADLADRILAAIHASGGPRRLRPDEMELLSAWLDGELPAGQAAEVSQRVQHEPDWQAAHEELLAVQAALDAYTAPPAGEGLAERVIAHCRRVVRRDRRLRLVRWLGPAAAAAAIVLAVWAGPWGRKPTPTPRPPVVAERPKLEPELEKSSAFRGVPRAERQELQEELIRNLSFFKDYEVVENFETLQAIERLENKGT